MKRRDKTHPVVPQRSFGNTGIKISKLCLGGGSFGATENQVLLDEALRHGIDCWEVVSFTGRTYGDYFANNPGVRQRVFLSGKVYSTAPETMQHQLETLLKENGTSYIDFLAIHHIDNIKMLTTDVMQWVDNVKRDKKIRFFGFCTHTNMVQCLRAASALGWIDSIQTVYNYRMQTLPAMEEALHMCHDKGIGIFAIKSMGLSLASASRTQNTSVAKQLQEVLKKHDLSFEQAKLKAICKTTE